METPFPSALPPGTEIGHYKLLKAVGQGGFGVTYAAWDKELGRRVAIKECVLAGLCYRDKESGRLVPISEAAAAYYDHAMLDMHREVRTLAALNHERIVPVYDVFLSQGGLFYTMPWLDGGSLADRVPTADRPAPDVKTVCRWLQQLLEGLTYLHGKGIIHRDIKPANILFNDRDEPVIIDFGAALNRPDRTTSTSQGEFSIAYGAPEQIIGKGHIGPWTDFYSLAAVFYELICGSRAESADKRLIDDGLLDLRGFPQAAGYPEPLLTAIMRNLSLPPVQRCQSGTEWQRLLDPGSLAAPGRPFRKSLWVVSALALLAVGGGVGYMAFSAKDAAVPPAGGEAVISPADLERSVRAYFHIDEWEQEYTAALSEFDAFYQEMQADYRAEADAINAKYKEINRDYVAAKRELELSQKWYPRLNNFETRFAEITKALPSSDEMMQKYPAKSNTEAALLPSVCQRIHRHCKELGGKDKKYESPVLQYMVDSEAARRMKSFNER